MLVQIIWKSHKDLIKTQKAMLWTMSNIAFFGIQGQVTPKSKSDLIGIRIHQRFYGCPGYLQVWRRFDQKWMLKFFIPQGWVTQKWIVWSGPKSNSSEILWLSLLPASLMKIQSKMKLLSSRQLFSHYKSMGDFRCRWNQSFDPICPKKLMLPFPHPNDATYKIWSRLANWPQRYSSLKVWTTDNKGWYTISSLCGPLAQET